MKKLVIGLSVLMGLVLVLMAGALLYQEYQASRFFDRVESLRTRVRDIDSIDLHDPDQAELWQDVLRLHADLDGMPPTNEVDNASVTPAGPAESPIIVGIERRNGAAVVDVLHGGSTSTSPERLYSIWRLVIPASSRAPAATHWWPGIEVDAAARRLEFRESDRRLIFVDSDGERVVPAVRFGPTEVWEAGKPPHGNVTETVPDLLAD